jgi:hypothetical protein
MAIKKARTSKKPTYAAAGDGSSVAMVEMPPHGPGGANHIQHPPPPLPPGVYFSPTREECLGFLNRHIAASAADNEMADAPAPGFIFRANVYGESPDALRLRHPPASVRGRGEHAWWFLSETRFQSRIVGGGASKRADRRVETGGYWRLEQSKEKLEKGKKRKKEQSSNEDVEEQQQEEEEAEGAKNSFGFYVGREKTPWLMQEFTSANDDGADKHGVPALYRVYVTPRATEKQLHDVFGEHDVKKGPDGEKLPARTMVPEEYFDAIAELLPEGSVRGVVQALLPPQVVPPPVDYYGEHGQYLGQYEQQQVQYLQYEQQHLQYEQQQGRFSVSPPLLGELTAEEPSDNLSMSMADFMRTINEQPVEMVDEQPAETAKGEEEPNWESLPDIVDTDELAKFYK